MDSRQYAWTVGNRRAYNVQPVFSGDETAFLLRAGARCLGQREVAAGAWERLLPPALLAVSRIESYSRGVLVVAAADSAAYHLLRQGAVRLRQELADVLPNLRELRFVPADRAAGSALADRRA
jgi:hypothetical protein